MIIIITFYQQRATSTTGRLQKNMTDSVAEWIRVLSFEIVSLRDQEGVGSNPGPGQVGRIYIHKVLPLKGYQQNSLVTRRVVGKNCLSLMPSLNKHKILLYHIYIIIIIIIIIIIKNLV